MHRECRVRFPHHWLQRKPLVNDPGVHHGTYVTCGQRLISESLTRGGGENVPGIPNACETRNITYLARGPSQGDADVSIKLQGFILKPLLWRFDTIGISSNTVFVMRSYLPDVGFWLFLKIFLYKESNVLDNYAIYIIMFIHAHPIEI